MTEASKTSHERGEREYFKIEPAKAGQRLDLFLTAVLTEVSRSHIQSLIREGQVLVNGKPAKAGRKLEVGDEVNCRIPEPEPLAVEPQAIELNIVYEDQDLIVINKPQGLVVHPAPGSRDQTLVNGLLYHCRDLSGINGVLRPGIVHRLDKDTSGLLAAAKNDRAHQALAAQLQERTMKRQYVALLHGVMAEPCGLVDAPIGRDPKDRQRMAVAAGGKEAVTEYQVLKRLENYTVVLCSLQTGRTHQIRVHMAYLGHPVAGDPKYGRRKEEFEWPCGQALHAWHLSFVHPVKGEKMDFYAPLPEYFAGVLSRLGGESILEELAREEKVRIS